MSPRVMILVLCPILAVLAGCAEVGSVEALQQRVISDADPDQVLTAAAAILQREFGRVKVDRAARRITTSPVEYTTERESGTARDLYRGRTIMRRSALFSVGRSGGATVARLRVDVERRDTERQAMFMPRTHRLSDNPGQETPIEADAATSQEQNTVWTRVRRDHRLERTLLDELRDYFARIAGETPALPSAGPPTEQATETAPGGETRD